MPPDDDTGSTPGIRLEPQPHGGMLQRLPKGRSPGPGIGGKRAEFQKLCRNFCKANFKRICELALEEPSLLIHLIQQGYGKPESPKESTSEALIRAQGELDKAKSTAYRIVDALNQYPECHEAVLRAIGVEPSKPGEPDAGE